MTVKKILTVDCKNYDSINKQLHKEWVKIMKKTTKTKIKDFFLGVLFIVCGVLIIKFGIGSQFAYIFGNWFIYIPAGLLIFFGGLIVIALSFPNFVVGGSGNHTGITHDDIVVANWKKGIEKYNDGFSKLPTDLVERTFATLRDSSLSTGIETKQMPDEVTWAITALTSLIKERRAGTAKVDPVSTDKREKYSEAVNEFCTMYPMICKAGTIAADQAMNKGLDFGIITNNAADAGLYSAMDYAEKKKNVSRSESTLKANMDAQVLKLLADINNA